MKHKNVTESLATRDSWELRELRTRDVFYLAGEHKDRFVVGERNVARIVFDVKLSIIRINDELFLPMSFVKSFTVCEDAKDEDTKAVEVQVKSPKRKAATKE